MKWTLILTCAIFFVATPVLISQTLPDIPSLPSTPSTSVVPTVPSTSFPTAFPSTSLPTSGLPTSISSSTLQQAGLDTSSLTQDPGARASALRDQYKQGLLDDQRMPSLPTTTDQASSLAKRFAEQTFPQEFQAAKGLLALPEAAPSSFPTSLSTPGMVTSSLPTTLPTGLPSSLPTTLPSGLPTSSPSIPTIPQP